MYKKKFAIIVLLILLFLSCATTDKKNTEKKLDKNEDSLYSDKNLVSKNFNNDELDNSLEPLSKTKLLQLVSDQIPWNFKAVIKDQNLLAIVHDLDKNGYEDVLVTVFDGANKEENRFEKLSETARLFNLDEKEYNYYLLIFYQYQGKLILRYTVPVSEQLVFTGIEPFSVRQNSDFPYALLFSFRNHSGVERKLIILSGFGISKFTIKENLSETTIIHDIDNDGYMDIIVHEQGFEEGTGFETFITWYKWNKRQYFKYKTTNVVRNLKKFFQTCVEYLKNGDISDFLNFALEPESLLSLKNQGLSDYEIMNLIFTPTKGVAAQSDYFSEKPFSSVVFPEIMETPFSYEESYNLHHKVVLRFNRLGENSMIFFAKLKMNKNPFEKKQFFFSP